MYGHVAIETNQNYRNWGYNQHGIIRGNRILIENIMIIMGIYL